MKHARLTGFALRGAYQIQKAYWKLFRPMTVGVRVLLVKESRVVLVKHCYVDGWFLPGGGVKKGERLEAAIQREVREELGASLGAIRLLGAYSDFRSGKSDAILVFICRDFDLRGSVDAEIREHGYFDMKKLPDGTSPGTRKRIEEFLNEAWVKVGDW